MRFIDFAYKGPRFRKEGSTLEHNIKEKALNTSTAEGHKGISVKRDPDKCIP